jgi:predicted nucleotidyltransferase
MDINSSQNNTMEFEPLYPAGFHDISMGNLENIFVFPFNDNTRRNYITRRFRDYIEKFSEVGLKAEIWIDGSYSTKKPDPSDMDILIVFDVNEVNQLPLDKQSILSELFNRDLSKIRYSIDVLLLPSHDTDFRSYWRGWFGFSRTEQPKGIPRIYYGVD